MVQGITDTVLMIRPKNFGPNPETLLDNKFQEGGEGVDPKIILNQAIEEFDDMVALLRKHDIEVIVIEDTASPAKPDAIFPNNWFSTHANGTISTYPMMSELRRLERRDDVVEKLMELRSYKKHYVFEYHEPSEEYLEGTGSMILDRHNKIVYAGLSQRTNIKVLEKFAVLYNYKKVIFHPFDRHGDPIYHTNVMMHVGTDLAVICLASIKSEEEQKEIKQSLSATNKTILDITLEQMEQFAGNMLEVKSKLGQKYLVMSNTAYTSLTDNQISTIEKHLKILHIPIPNIEKYGGGSVRCMIAEIY